MCRFLLWRIFFVFASFVIFDFPGNSATPKQSARSGDVNVSNARPSGVIEKSRPFIEFNMKSPVSLPVQEFRIKLKISGMRPIAFKWMKDTADIVAGGRLKIADQGRQLVLDPPFTRDDSGMYDVLACNSVGCTIRGVQVIFNERNLLVMTLKKPDENTKVLAWVGGTVGILCFVGLIMAAIIAARRYWSRWIFVKQVKEEYHSQTTSSHGGNDPFGWLWAWRTAKEAGFQTSDEEETNEYDDHLRLNTKKAQRRYETRRKVQPYMPLPTKPNDATTGQPSSFKELHNLYRAKKEVSPLSKATAFEIRHGLYRRCTNKHAVESSMGQMAPTASSMAGQMTPTTSSMAGQMAPTTSSMAEQITPTTSSMAGQITPTTASTGAMTSTTSNAAEMPAYLSHEICGMVETSGRVSDDQGAEQTATRQTTNENTGEITQEPVNEPEVRETVNVERHVVP